LNTIELWVRDPTNSPVYWLNGLAGTGKSTIAKTIAERLFADGKLGGSFFCSRDFEDRRNLQLISPTLATQLARKYPEFRSIFVPLVQSDPKIAYESLYNQMNKLIVQPLKRSGISTVIVIDALDECEDEGSASAILSVLGRLVSEIPNVKFFLTGRPEPRISEGFLLPLLAKMTDTFVLHDVERDQVDSDIRLFFRTSFLELTSRMSGLDNWPTEQQVELLCGRAAGLFVYAAVAVRFIDDDKRGPRDQLDLLLDSDKVGAREGEALDALYTSILQEAFSDDDDPEDDAKTRSVLGVVILAVNPLSPSAIATLLGFDTEDVPPLLSLAKSLLVLQDDPSHPVRPFHKSFPDFITDPARCTNARFHIPPADHHLQFLMSCLGLMDRTLAKNMCKLPDGVANSDIGDLEERIKECIDPALQYSCVSWHAHLIDIDTTPVHAPTVTPTLYQFLEKKFLSWLEALSVLGAVSNGVDALQAAGGWLEVCRVYARYPAYTYSDWIQEPATLDLTNDCFRFVMGYFEVINTSAPHIYHSALAFAPQNSIVRKLYGPQVHPFTGVVHGLPMSWDTYTAATTRPSDINGAVWSPCNRFIAITWEDATIEVLDPVTLRRLQILEFPRGHGSDTDMMALVFSPDSRVLTCFRKGLSKKTLSVVSWDLQTGGVASVINPRWRGPIKDIEGTPSITYSANGKMVAVRVWHLNGNHILFFDVASGAYIRSHSPTNVIAHANGIWDHEESFRFTTVSRTAVTIWEVGLTPYSMPTKVKTLPFPGGHFRSRLEAEPQEEAQFLPSSSRLALVSEDQVVVWDTHNSKCLLYCADTRFYPRMSFSSDGRFFACSTTGTDVYLWEETPTGYILHQTLTSSTTRSRPLISTNGESIVVFGGSAIRLWHTKDLTVPPSSVSTRTPRLARNFVADFSPDGVLVAFARLGGGVVTILDLKSGSPHLTISAKMNVYGLRVIGDTITVVGAGKVVTWDLPVGGQVPNAKMTLKDSTRTINLSDPPPTKVVSAAISPLSCPIALVVGDILGSYKVRIYNGSTGEQLSDSMVWSTKLWFTPGGRDLWLADDRGERVTLRESEGWEREEDEGRVDVEDPPEGYPWASSHGYRVTKDWWVLGPDGKRLLVLPPSWQSHMAALRVWKGRFLVLLHGGLPEPVILELDP